MTVASDSNKCLYVGNGVTRVWPYSFLLYNAAHLEVWVKRGEAEPVRLERGYALNELERTVTYPVDGTGEAPLSDKDRIILMRIVPVLQLLDLVNQGNFFSEDIEQNFDLLVMMIQQHNEILHRSLLFGVDFDGEVDTQNILNMVQFNHDSYPEIVEARNLCVDAKATVLPARDETLEYKNTAEALVNRALAASAEAWKANRIYVYPNVVAAPDGFSYRCISTTGVTNEYPPTSPYWCRLLVDLEEFFTWDNEGDLMPEAYPTQSSKWSIDADGDIFPIY